MKTVIRLLGALLALLAALGALIFVRRRHIIARLLALDPPRSGVRVEWNLHLLMRDGARLAADHYYPRQPGRYPTVLVRTPYGRNHNHGIFGFLVEFLVQRFAERGYHVLVQDIRGRFDSEGTFDPYFQERADGLDTLAWISTRSWFNGQLATWGPSYLGIVQWVIADAPPVSAMLPIVTSARLRGILFPDNAFDLGLALRWIGLFQMLDLRWRSMAPGALRRHLRMLFRPDYRVALRAVLEHVELQSLLAAAPLLQNVETTIAPGFNHLPLIEVDTLVHGSPVDYFRNWISRPDASDPMWQEVEQAVNMARIDAPVHLVGGWYDFFLRGLLNDYAELRAAGKNPYLTIGHWNHFSNGMMMIDGLHTGLDWFDAQLKGHADKLRAQPVRIYVMGLEAWRDLPAWPPPARETRVYLHSGRSLTFDPPQQPEAADTYRYDPADPTPVIGGAQFSPLAGPVKNARLEARRDVLVYTSAPLARDLELVGPVRLELFAQSSLAHTDFFGRLCDVYPDGRSINICDGLLRTDTGRESGCVAVDMWSTAYYFRAGHRLRLIVGSGAHPRWNRNFGTGEPIATSAALCAADQTIYHDAARPSALVLPVTAGRI